LPVNKKTNWQSSCYAFLVERDYDLFELMPDNMLLWRQKITGHANAIRVLKEIAAKTTNEVRVMHLPTKAVVATMDAPAS
jgi:hypothetical protein